MKNTKKSKKVKGFALMDLMLVAAMIVALLAIAVFTICISGM